MRRSCFQEGYIPNPPTQAPEPPQGGTGLASRNSSTRASYKMNCGTCKFWKLMMVNEAKEVGECHRYPPCVPPHLHTIQSYPMLQADEWCGEFMGKTCTTCDGKGMLPAYYKSNPTVIPEGICPACCGTGIEQPERKDELPKTP